MPNKKQSAGTRAYAKTKMLIRIPPAMIELTPGQRLPTIEDEDVVFIRSCLGLYLRKKDPIALITVFVESMKLGIYPPVAILQAMRVAFQTVIAGKGKKTLDQVLGLRGSGKGKWSAITKHTKTGMHYWLASTIWGLTIAGRLSVNQAAERVSFYLESYPNVPDRFSPDPKPGRTLYTAEGLADQYSRTWKTQFRLDRLAPKDPLHPSSWSPTAQSAFLKQFPDPSQAD